MGLVEEDQCGLIVNGPFLNDCGGVVIVTGIQSVVADSLVSAKNHDVEASKAAAFHTDRSF